MSCGGLFVRPVLWLLVLVGFILGYLACKFVNGQ